MSDRKTETVSTVLTQYQQLAALAVEETAAGRPAERLTEIVDAMSEGHAKAMLIARIGVEAAATHATTERSKLN